MSRKGHQNGFTLIESMIAVLILAIITTLSVPSFVDALEKRRLEMASEDLYMAIRYARSEAVKQSSDVTIQISGSGSSWCYGIDDEPATTCNCQVEAHGCTISGQDKVFTNNMAGGPSPFGNTQLHSGGSLTFEAMRGFLSGASATTISVGSDDKAMDIIVNQIGFAYLTPSTSG